MSGEESDTPPDVPSEALLLSEFAWSYLSLLGYTLPDMDGKLNLERERAALRYVLGNSDARAEFIRALNQGVTEATLHELDSIRSALFPG